MPKRLPRMNNDEEAEALLENDLSDYLDPTNFSLVSFEFEPKDTSISIRMSSTLLHTVKEAAKRRGMSYQRYIREAVERSLHER